MFGELITKTKKSLVLTATGVFAITAAANAYEAPEQSYIIQGASPSTMIKLVEAVGGEVIQDISLTGGISASLTEQEVALLRQNNALLRFDDKSTDNKVAGFVWRKLGKNGKKTAAIETELDNKVAGFVWRKLGKNGKKTAAIEAELDNKVAGFVWRKLGKNGKKTAAMEAELDNKVAGFVWRKLGKNGKKTAAMEAELDNKVAGFVWRKLGKNGKKTA